MLTLFLTILFIALIIALLFGPDAWGYTSARSPIVLILVIVLIVFLLFHPF
jgi:fumarate reductase subunit C